LNGDHRGGPPILIAGGGIGGLAAALALARTGRQTAVLESRAQSNEEGAGIQIGPNGVHALRWLGIADRLEPLVGKPRAIAVMDGKSGRCLTRLPLIPRMEAVHGAPYWVTRRLDLHQVLLQAAMADGRIEIIHDFKVAQIALIAQRASDKAAGVRVSSPDGRQRTGAGLVGADGLWSTVARSWLDAPPLRFTHRTATRALIPLTGLPAPFGEAVTGLWLGPKAHLVHYPVSAGPMGMLLNIVAIVEGGPSLKEWGAPVAGHEVLPAFAGWTQPVRDLVENVSQWRRWSLLERGDLPKWSHGPVTVLGDAAHPVLPFLAQGAVLALEDAITLAGMVAAAPEDLSAAFQRYGAARQRRARRVAAASRRNGQIYHLSGVAALSRNWGMSAMPPGRLIASYDWLYGYREASPMPALSK
jgi:salicylate hydroxylase